MPATLTLVEQIAREAAADRADLQRVCDEAQYRRDAWAWLTECVSTVDELDPQTPIKPFPTSVCVPCATYAGGQITRCPRCGGATQALGYLETLTRQWQSAQPPILLVPKARRMKLTWLFCALHAWLAWRQPHANVFLVSDKEDKSGELVDRCDGILARLPEDRCARPRVRRWASPPMLEFADTGSQIMGVAEGASQLRQFTATAVLADEFAHWEHPRAAYTAMLPCIEGGGRITILSSPAPGFLRELITGEAF